MYPKSNLHLFLVTLKRGKNKLMIKGFTWSVMNATLLLYSVQKVWIFIYTYTYRHIKYKYAHSFVNYQVKVPYHVGSWPLVGHPHCLACRVRGSFSVIRLSYISSSVGYFPFFFKCLNNLLALNSSLPLTQYWNIPYYFESTAGLSNIGVS